MAESKVPIERRKLILITAAVAAVCGKNARILGITPVDSEQTADTWTRVGRLSIHGSHRPGQAAAGPRPFGKQHPGATPK